MRRLLVAFAIALFKRAYKVSCRFLLLFAACWMQAQFLCNRNFLAQFFKQKVKTSDYGIA